MNRIQEEERKKVKKIMWIQNNRIWECSVCKKQLNFNDTIERGEGQRKGQYHKYQSTFDLLEDVIRHQEEELQNKTKTETKTENESKIDLPENFLSELNSVLAHYLYCKTNNYYTEEEKRTHFPDLFAFFEKHCYKTEESEDE